ncbi:MAG TPA: hypothetical protein VEU96_30755 [Bryobacteraceae bacterium]|nr:hypothetical protein [Bryobacteraceae bacterium]
MIWNDLFRIRALCLTMVGLTAGAVGARSAVRFEENLGQTGKQVRYLAHASGKTFYFGDHQLYIELWGAGEFSSVVQMSFAGSTPQMHCHASGGQTDTVSYLVGSDPNRWVRDAQQFSRLEWKGIYPGIDAVFYGDGDRLEYDLVLAPGSDPAAVRLTFTGDGSARAAADGAVEVTTPAGVFRQRAPRIYQEGPDGTRRPVDGGFVSGPGAHEFRLQLETYDSELPLVVDPVLEFSTYLGGENDDQVKVVGDGFVAGNTASVAFPGVPVSRRRSRDIFLASTATSNFSYGFFGRVVIGGSGDDDLTAAVVINTSSRPEFYLAGATNSPDFPAGIAGAPARYVGGATDAFLVHVQTQQFFAGFDATLIGGSGEDRITALVASGSTVLGVGVTDSPDLPVKLAFQPALAGGKDAFVFTAGPFSSAVQQLSYLGGSADDAAYAVAITSAGIVVGGETQSPDFPVVGGWQTAQRQGPSDAFVALLKYASSGMMILQSSALLGGSGEDRIQAITVRSVPYYYYFSSSPVIAVTGTTSSPDFPLLNPVQDKFGGVTDAFLLRLDVRDGSLSFSTFLGGSDAEEGTAVAMDAQDNIAVAGATHSTDLQTVQALQPNPAGGEDGFLAYIDANNRLQQLSYFGGSGDDHIYGVAFAGTTARIVGSTTSTDLPLVNPWQIAKDDGMDGFIADVGTAYIIAPDRLVLGKDLAVGLSLSAAQNTSRIPLTLHSSDPSKVRFSQNGKPFGEVTLTGPWTTTVEALADSGQVDLIASADGLPAKTIAVTLRPAALQLLTGSISLTTWSRPQGLSYSLVAWNPDTNQAEGYGYLRDGVAPLQISWASSDESVAKVTPPDSYGSSLVVPVGAGTAQLTLSCTTLPVLPTDSISVTVVRPAIKPSDMTLGKDLQTNLRFTLFQNDTLPLLNPLGKGTVTFRSSDPSRLLLSLDGNMLGQEAVTVDSTQTSSLGLPPVWAQALSSDGQVKVLIASTEIAADQEIVVTLARTIATLVPSFGGSLNLTVGNTSTIFPRLTFEGDTSRGGFSVRPGKVLHYSFSTSDSKVVTVSPATVDSTSVFPPSVTAVGLGTAQIGITVDDPEIAVAGPLPVTVAPIPPAPLPAGQQLYLGKDLRTQLSLPFRLPANSEAVITVADPTLAVVSPDGTSTGQAQIRKLFSGDLNFWVYGLAAAGQTTIRVQITGGGTVDSTVTLAPSGFAFSTSFLSATFYSSGSIPIASYALDDLTGIPYLAQPLRPGVKADLSFQQDGTAVALNSPQISFTSDSDLSRTSVGYTVKGIGDTSISFNTPSGFTAPSRRTSVKIRIAPSTIGFDGALIAANYATMSVGFRIDNGFQTAEITATSGDPTRLLVGGSAGEAATSAFVPRGARLLLTALADSGVVPLHLTGPGLEPLDVMVPLYPLQVSVAALSPLTLLSQTGGVQWFLGIGVANFGNLSLTLRPDAPPLRVEFTSTDSSVVTVDPAVVELTTARPNASVMVKPGLPGNTQILLQVPPGYTIDRTQIAVTVRAPKFSIPKVLLGKDTQGAVGVTPEGTPLDNKILTLTSLSPDRLLLSRTPVVRGSASVSLAYAVGAGQGPLVYLQALANDGEASIRISAEGYADAISTVVLVPSALVLNPGDFNLELGAVPAQRAVFIQASPAAPIPDAMSLGNVTVRPGGPTISAPVTIADASVASVDQQVTFAPGDTLQYINVKPVAAGTTTLTVGVPDGFADPGLARRTASVQVVLRTLSVNCTTNEIGKDAQEFCSVSLPPNVAATAVSSQPSSVLVSFDPKAAGSARATASGSGTLFVQALADNGSAEITLSAPGYRDAKLTFQLRPSVFLFVDTTVSASSIPINVGATRDVDIQFRRLQASGDLWYYNSTLRPGAAPVRIDVTSTNPSVLQVSANSVTFAPGDVSKTIRLTGVAKGSAAVRASTPPGFAAPPRDQAFYTVQ